MRVPPEEGAWLEAADGRRHPIKGSCSIGRAGANTIVLESPKVSRRHALIHLQNIGELWLIDFGSSNGTFLNKRRIHHPIRLSDGDQITIGDQVFKVRDPVAISEGVQNGCDARDACARSRLFRAGFSSQTFAVLRRSAAKCRVRTWTFL